MSFSFDGAFGNLNRTLDEDIQRRRQVAAAGQLADAYQQSQPQTPPGGLSGMGTGQPPAAPLPVPAAPGPAGAPVGQPLGYAASPPGGVAMPPAAMPQPQPAASPAPAPSGLPSMAAVQGMPTGTGVGGMLSSLNAKYGLPDGYLTRTAGIESNFNPNAYNKGSGASGPFQFVPSTAAQYGVSNPQDWAQSAMGAAKLASDNAAVLQQALGRPPTGGELYLAHQQGAGGAAKLLANPTARAGDLVGDAAVRSNGGDPNMPAGLFAAKWTSKFPDGSPVGTIGNGAPLNSPAPQGGGSPYGALSPMGLPGAAPQQASGITDAPALAFQGSTGFSQPQPQQPPPGGSMGAAASGQAVPIDASGNALGYQPPGAAASAPAQKAITAVAPPSNDPLVSVPGYAGQWNKAKIAAAPDGTDVPDDGELAKAQAPVGGALPTAPSPAQPAAAPLIPGRPPQAEPIPVSPQNGGINPTIIAGLLRNPDTQSVGMQLWQQSLGHKDFGFQVVGDQLVRTNAQTGEAIPVPGLTKAPQLQHFAGKDGSEYAFNPQTGASTKMQDGGPGTTTIQPADYAKFNIDPNYKGVVQQDSDGKIIFPSPPIGKNGSASNHVIGPGGALVDATGKPLYTNTGGGGMDAETVDSLARRVYLGDTTALVGLSRGAQGGQNVAAVQKRVAEIAAQQQGQPAMSAPESDILTNRADQLGAQAGARASGTLNARLDTYAKEASGAMDLGLAASRQVPRTTWTPLNRAIQSIQGGSGDPQLAAFVAANNAIINTYAKAINPNGVPTVSDKVHASEVLSTAQSPEAYEATVQQLQREINIAHNAARGARAAERSGTAGNDIPETAGQSDAPGSQSVSIWSRLMHPFGGGQTAQPAAPTTAAPSATGYTPAPTSTDALTQARSAIQQGADPKAVRQRLQAHGIDPGGL